MVDDVDGDGVGEGDEDQREELSQSGTRFFTISISVARFNTSSSARVSRGDRVIDGGDYGDGDGVASIHR